MLSQHTIAAVVTADKQRRSRVDCRGATPKRPSAPQHNTAQHNTTQHTHPKVAVFRQLHHKHLADLLGPCDMWRGVRVKHGVKIWPHPAADTLPDLPLAAQQLGFRGEVCLKLAAQSSRLCSSSSSSSSRQAARGGTYESSRPACGKATQGMLQELRRSLLRHAVGATGVENEDSQ